MNNLFQFKTLTEFTDFFRDEETCVKHFTAVRFANGGYCPHCGNTKIHLFANGKRYRCAGCKQDFTIKTGTVFGESKLPLRKWFMAIYLLSTTSKGISSVQLAKHVGVTQKTAWFMAHRIRQAHKQNGNQFTGTVESDETYIGGKASNMHKKVRKTKIRGRGFIDKAIVHGMIQRAQGDQISQVKASVIQNTQRETIAPILAENIVAGSTLYTDTAGAYKQIETALNHAMVDHAKGYVVGDCHTNNIESFWAIFKRGYNGVYHQMSRKHLHRYVNEFAFRFNRRKTAMQSVFSEVVSGIAESAQFPYKTLTQ